MAKRKKKSAEEIATENELLKLKMMAEFGGNFIATDQIPPEIEHQFLKQISKFHKKNDAAHLVPIYDYIGMPSYNHLSDLGEKEIAKELNKLLKLLARKGIMAQTLGGVSDKEMYKWITEELFKHEVQNIHIKDWTIQFFYEEFHPSDEFDIKNQVTNAVSLLFEGNLLGMELIFSEDMKNEIGLSLDREEFVEKLENFKSRFHQILVEDLHFKLIDIDIELNTAHVLCEVEYRTQTQKGRKFKINHTTLEANLTKDETTQLWMVTQLLFDDL